MDKEQYMLNKVMEECAELQVACSKAKRFGLASKDSITGLSNAESIMEEYEDLKFSMFKLQETAKPVGIRGGTDFMERMDNFELYYKISVKLGKVK